MDEMNDRRRVSVAPWGPLGLPVAAVAWILAVLLTAAVSCPLPASAAGLYQILGTTSSPSGSLVRTEFTVQVGTNPLDRFRFYRWVQNGPGGGRSGSILLLPPLGPGYSFYEQRDPSGGAGSTSTSWGTTTVRFWRSAAGTALGRFWRTRRRCSAPRT